MTTSNTTSAAWKGFEVVMTTDVPVVRQTQALPFPWAPLAAKFEDPKRKPAELPSFVVPKQWWIDEQGLTDATVNDKGDKVLTADNMAGRIKAAFSTYRAGVEKTRGDLVAYGVAVEKQNTDGEWAGHRVVLVAQDIEARKEAIKRGQALAAKAAKAKGTKAKGTKAKAKAA
jgi:hypothetical protein